MQPSPDKPPDTWTTPSQTALLIGAHPRSPLSLLLLGKQILPRIPKTRSPLFPNQMYSPTIRFRFWCFQRSRRIVRWPDMRSKEMLSATPIQDFSLAPDFVYRSAENAIPGKVLAVPTVGISHSRARLLPCQTPPTRKPTIDMTSFLLEYPYGGRPQVRSAEPQRGILSSNSLHALTAHRPDSNASLTPYPSQKRQPLAPSPHARPQIACCPLPHAEN